MLDLALEKRNGEPAYRTQLDNLCDQTMREKDQKKSDQILRLLAEYQEVLEKPPVHILVVPIHEENNVD